MDLWTYIYDSHSSQTLAPATMLSKIEQLFIDSRCTKKANHIQNTVKLVEFFYRTKSSQISWIDKLMDIELDTMNLLQAELRVTTTVQHLEKLKKLNGNLTDEEEKSLYFW